MRITNAKEAIDAYKLHDDWRFADREAAWQWMFERGREAAELAQCKRSHHIDSAAHQLLERALGALSGASSAELAADIASLLNKYDQSMSAEKALHEIASTLGCEPEVFAMVAAVSDLRRDVAEDFRQGFIAAGGSSEEAAEHAQRHLAQLADAAPGQHADASSNNDDPATAVIELFRIDFQKFQASPEVRQAIDLLDVAGRKQMLGEHELTQECLDEIKGEMGASAANHCGEDSEMQEQVISACEDWLAGQDLDPVVAILWVKGLDEGRQAIADACSPSDRLRMAMR